MKKKKELKEKPGGQERRERREGEVEKKKEAEGKVRSGKKRGRGKWK